MACISGQALAANTDTHCLANEHVYFSCGIDGSDKVVSLCGGMKDSQPSWLQYRFGAIGHTELTYPKAKKGSLQKFAGFFESHKAIPFHIEEVWFRIGKHHYSVESTTSGLNAGEPPCSEDKPCITNELDVKTGGHFTTMRCTEGATNNLTLLRGYISDDQADR